jgi:hypothetical protein
MDAILALFEPNSESSAIVKLAALICWFLAAFSGGVAGRFAAGALGLVGLGLGLFFLPDVWTAVDLAFD